MKRTSIVLAAVLVVLVCRANGADLALVEVDGQPLGANVLRLVQALDYLGSPLPQPTIEALTAAAKNRDATALQKLLDPGVLLAVSLNPELRVKVDRGPAKAMLQQAGWTPILIKVVNQSTATKSLRIISPQAGPVYAGVAQLSMQRQQQPQLRENENTGRATDRFLAVEMFTDRPMTAALSGLEVEYAIALVYASEGGQREATIGFDAGQGTQDLGFRAETPVLFDIQPAVQVKLTIEDFDGQPTVGRLLFRDRQGRVYPPQPKRLAPDLFFQPQIYRHSGEAVLLPPGKFTLQASRGPEYRVVEQEVVVPQRNDNDVAVNVRLARWVNPQEDGFYGGDHHIHAAGCAHYTSPTEGVSPADMFRQVKGEGLNVGCVLTWGPCYDYQRRFFEPKPHDLSDRRTLLKYDLEISGFGSAALGHVCLLNLKDQTYPGSDGTATKGWPTWTTPVMRWAKEQGGVTGYAHSASGLAINSENATRRLLEALDGNRDGRLSAVEATRGLLPEEFGTIDADRDGQATKSELVTSHDRAAEQLPNLAIPEMNGVGAMEICVACAEGVCDFISAMDTARIQEWNTWYHLLNCGFPLKASGETDFPCMSSRNVGQGRVYVQLGEVDQLDFAAWCEGLRRGRSYVSDGYAHALEFQVNGQSPGTDDVPLAEPGEVLVQARVAFAPETPAAVSHGMVAPPGGKRFVGDTVQLHVGRSEEMVLGGERLVEIVVNGKAVASRKVPADGQPHTWKVPIRVDRSSWVALRQFPQLHTNPVNVIVANQPIRASRRSAQWCAGTIDLLWKNREKRIAADERAEAYRTFQKALARYGTIAAECDEGS
jgi:hypothetical protein